MKKSLFFLLLSLPLLGLGQDMTDIAHQHIRTNRQGMYILGSWGVTNLAAGTTAWLLADEGEGKYFHQMNAGWNLVNIGLSAGGIFGAKKDLKRSFTEEEYRKMKGLNTRIYLFNAGIDFAYITGGFLLREMARTRPDQSNRLRGYGNSLILQGGFLLVFDATMAWVSNRPAKSGSASISALPGGICLRF